MKIIITGNIGSGKSSVTKIFEKEGYFVISADEISHEILKDNHVKIAKYFSMPPQQFDTFKKKLSNMVFSNNIWYDGKTFKEHLENIMLPLINEKINYLSSECEKNNKKYVVEAPTFFEVNGLKHFAENFIILIQTDKDIRIQRIMERNKHLSIQDVLDRIKSQIDPFEKEEFSDKIIWNNNGINDLEIKIFELIKSME